MKMVMMEVKLEDRRMLKMIILMLMHFDIVDHDDEDSFDDNFGR